jgi:hypothetical protein
MRNMPDRQDDDIAGFNINFHADIFAIQGALPKQQSTA